MKRIILSMMTLLAIVSLQAQDKDGGIHIIPRAGINFSNLTLEVADEKIDSKIKLGFHIGADVEIPLAADFYIQPGLLFSTKGAKDDESEANGSVHLSYLELPVTFFYKPVLGSGRLLLGAGPYAAMAVGGKVKEDGEEDRDIEFEGKVSAAEYDFTKLYMKRSDFGLNLAVGYELSMGLLVQLNAQLGLTNNGATITDVPGESDIDTKVKNTLFGLSVGYRF